MTIHPRTTRTKSLEHFVIFIAIHPRARVSFSYSRYGTRTTRTKKCQYPTIIERVMVLGVSWYENANFRLGSLPSPPKSVSVPSAARGPAHIYSLFRWAGSPLFVPSAYPRAGSKLEESLSYLHNRRKIERSLRGMRDGSRQLI